MEGTIIQKRQQRYRKTSAGSNYLLIIGTPLLLLTIFCVAYPQLSHPRPATGSLQTTASHSLPVSTRHAYAPLIMQTPQAAQSTLTAQSSAASTQPLPTQAAPQVPNPANQNSPQAAGKSNQVLQKNNLLNQTNSNPQKSLLHLAVPN